MHRYNIFTTWNNEMVIQKLHGGILLKQWDLLLGGFRAEPTCNFNFLRSTRPFGQTHKAEEDF